MKPGEIPELNLPVKSIPSIQPVPRSSAESILIKKQNNTPSSASTIVFPCYKRFDELKKRIESLKLPSSWEIVHTNDNIVFKFHDDIDDFGVTTPFLIFSCGGASWTLTPRLFLCFRVKTAPI